MRNAYHHRFWCCARYPDSTLRFAEDDGIILILNPISVQLLTEREFLDRTGQRAGAAPPAPQAQSFAQLVSQLFTSANPPQHYVQLLNDFRLIEVAQLPRFKNINPDSLSYLLHEHPLTEDQVPDYVGGVRRCEDGEVTCATHISERQGPNGRFVESQEQVQRYRLSYRGGVEAKVGVNAPNVRQEPAGAFADLRRRVRASRPSTSVWIWEIR